MVAVARGRFQILQNVVKAVRDWGRFIKTVKKSVSVQGAIIVLRASPAKQRVGCEAEKYREILSGVNVFVTGNCRTE